VSPESIAKALGSARREGAAWRCLCPVHDDHNPSLSVEDRDGKTLVICRAGCSQDAVIGALRARGLWPNPNDDNKRHYAKGHRRIVASYNYRDETGALRYQVCRTEPKGFLQRRPNGSPENWINNLTGIDALPYRLPDLLNDPAATVLIPEGEKDCDALAALGFIATTNHGGAGKWRPEISHWLAGRNVVILPDNDEPGRAHARDVAAKLAGNAETIRTIDLPGLPPKGDISDWIDAGGAAEQLDAILRDLNAAAGAKTKPNGAAAKHSILVLGGLRHEAADKGLDAMREAGVAFYERDRTIVRVCPVRAKNVDGAIIHVPGIVPVTAPMLGRALGKSADWACIGKRGEQIAIDPPKAVVEQILAMTGEWPFPPLSGVIGCPTLRPDGSLLSVDGYDAATGLALHSNISIGSIPEMPSKEDALRALASISELLREFPFANEESRATAHSQIMTPVLRGMFTVVPMHLTNAPQPGTGKSYLADLASVIATGERAAVISVAPNPEETEKRLVGAALAGFPIIALDNCREFLQGDFLCQVTERPLLQLRRLGSSDQIRIANSFCVFANGNNASVADDLVRRTISTTLDANMESPEKRTFRNNPLAMVRGNRGNYVAAVLTIARAYIAAGKPGLLPPLPSFERWSDIVRSSLVWLGLPDPVETMEAARGTDPVREDRAAVFEAWRTELGVDEAYLSHEIADLAVARYEYDNSFVRPSLRSALLAISAKRGMSEQIDAKRLGMWLKNNENTIINGHKMTVDRSDKTRPRWRLRWHG